MQLLLCNAATCAFYYSRVGHLGTNKYYRTVCFRCQQRQLLGNGWAERGESLNSQKSLTTFGDSRSMVRPSLLSYTINYWVGNSILKLIYVHCPRANTCRLLFSFIMLSLLPKSHRITKWFFFQLTNIRYCLKYSCLPFLWVLNPREFCLDLHDSLRTYFCTMIELGF